MSNRLPFKDYDPQTAGAQYIEDLATAYWYSEALFTAVEFDIFSVADADGISAEYLSAHLDVDALGVKRLMDALVSLGLLTCHDDRYFNTSVSEEYLVRGRQLYQGDSVLWRRELQPVWLGLADCVKTGGRTCYVGADEKAELKGRIKRYVAAMNAVAGTKAGEILVFFDGMNLKGRLLDVGAGSGLLSAAFLNRFPDMSAELIDLPDIIIHTKAAMKGRGLGRRIKYHAANILERWPVKRGHFDLIILSNIIHAYSERELPHILEMAEAALKKDGIILLHDFFFGHCPEKAALSDLNMLINTYNGKVFSSGHVIGELNRIGLLSSGLVPLESDTAVLFASRSEKALNNLSIDPIKRLMQKMKDIGLKKTYGLDACDIVVSDWPEVKCRFGCSRYQSPHCPPNSLTPQKTRKIIKTYRRAILLEGEPPARAFQTSMLRAEREAFLSGFQRAFSFWAGPCSVCSVCSAETACRNTENARPSMEGSGIDVFETARRAGARIRTLKSRQDFVKYFGLILLD